jgi:pimeloyl-ACP methyl ester carboxylesterase
MLTGSELAPRRSGPEVSTWLALGDEAIHAVIHTPQAGRWRRTAVLMLPMFGLEDECSYRSRRVWARTLCEAGFPTVRIDLPGTEDSVGPTLAGDRARSWLETVRATSRWLRRAAAVDRLAVLGVGLGGLLAAQAASSEAAIDETILWAVPSRGRAYMRELRMLAAAVLKTTDPAAKLDRADGASSFGGHLMSAETVASLNALDLTELPFVHGAKQRTLLIGRGVQGADKRLHEHLLAQGLDVTLAGGGDYAAMIADSQISVPPTATIDTSIAWLAERSPRSGQPTELLRSPEICDPITFEVGGATIRERHVEYETATGRMVGILTEPDGEQSPVCVISGNAGSLRRTAPSRLWTELARRSAARGIASLRIDRNGVGESDGHLLTRADRVTPELADRVISSHIGLADALEHSGVASRFVLAGLCLDAYWALQVALRDERVDGVALLNLPAFTFTRAQGVETERRRALRPLKAENLRARLREPRLPHAANVAALFSGLAKTVTGTAAAARRSQAQAISSAFRQLEHSATETLMLFGEWEPVIGQLEHAGVGTSPEWPRLHVVSLPTHNHELRQPQIQEQIAEHVEELLDTVVAARTEPVASLR